MIRFLSFSIPAVPSAPAASSEELNSFVDMVGNVWNVVLGVTWAGVPVLYWFIGAAVFGLIVAFIKGEKR